MRRPGVARQVWLRKSCGGQSSRLTDGNFISYNQRTGGAPARVQRHRRSATLGDALTCITAVGNDGCELAPRTRSRTSRAFTTRRSIENEGFLRADAMLAVVWLTDDDDCSALESIA